MKKLLIFCVALGFVFAISGMAQADTLYVDTNDSFCDDSLGSPYCTIQAAIDAAGVGDTIIVADGIYTITGRISVNNGVTITGNVANPANVLVKYSPASSTLHCVEVNSADVTIQGIKVQDCKDGFHFNRNVNTNTGVTISNCIIESVSRWGMGEISSPNTVISHNTITNAGDKGIYFRKCEGTSESNRCEAISNVISGCGWPAIQTYFSKYAYIYDNTISSTNDKGINIIRSGATGTAEGVQVIGNTISETKWPGIQVIGAPYTYVYSNTLTKCNYHGSDGTGDWDYASIHVEDDGAVSGANVIIDSNIVSDGINGIQTWSDGCEITNNSIYDMGLTYANTKTTADGTYYNSGIIIGSNWLTNNFKPTGTTVTCNNIYDNYWGLYVRDYATLSPDDESVLSVTAENNWWGAVDGPTGAGTGSGDAVSDNVDYDPWSFTPDPCEAKTMGFWKNHEDSVDAVLSLFTNDEIPLGDYYTVTSYDDAKAVFKKAKNKNANTMLAAQLLAAKLNVAHLEHLDIDYCECIKDVIESADEFLNNHGYNGPDDPGTVPREDKEKANGYKDDRDVYNEGLCTCP
jgi:hypothetical protein